MVTELSSFSQRTEAEGGGVLAHGALGARRALVLAHRARGGGLAAVDAKPAIGARAAEKFRTYVISQAKTTLIS